MICNLLLVILTLVTVLLESIEQCKNKIKPVSQWVIWVNACDPVSISVTDILIIILHITWNLYKAAIATRLIKPCGNTCLSVLQ